MLPHDENGRLRPVPYSRHTLSQALAVCGFRHKPCPGIHWGKTPGRRIMRVSDGAIMQKPDGDETFSCADAWEMLRSQGFDVGDA